MATREQHTQAERVTPPLSALVRSLAKRALRWLTGKERRDANANTQAESGPALARAEAKGDAKTERVRPAAQEAAKCIPQDQIQIEADRRATQALAVTESSLPLVSIRTKSGTIFYAYRLDLIAAWTDGHRDVPLCFLDGSQVQLGGAHRATLRLSSINAAQVAPCDAVVLASHMHDDQNRENSHDTPSIVR